MKLVVLIVRQKVTQIKAPMLAPIPKLTQKKMVTPMLLMMKLMMLPKMM